MGLWAVFTSMNLKKPCIFHKMCTFTLQWIFQTTNNPGVWKTKTLMWSVGINPKWSRMFEWRITLWLFGPLDTIFLLSPPGQLCELWGSQDSLVFQAQVPTPSTCSMVLSKSLYFNDSPSPRNPDSSSGIQEVLHICFNVHVLRELAHVFPQILKKR